MDKTLEELKAEADVLGLEYNKNIGATKLSEKIEAYYESQAAGDSVKVQSEEKEEEAPKKANGKETDEQRKRRKVMEAKNAAMKLRRVTITNNDTRENGVLTADYFGFENQHFGKSLLVPFNIPCELPQCILNVINSTYVTLHTDEIVDGKRTGNKVPKSMKKYNISYEDVK